MKNNILISSLCFDYRDDVLFWVFLFELNQTKIVRDFTLSCPNNKIRKDNDKDNDEENDEENHPEQLHLMVLKKEVLSDFFGQSFHKLLLVKDSIEIKGQQRSIPVNIRENKLHPMGGTKRLVSLMLLGDKEVQIVVKEESKSECVRDYSLDSNYFKNIPKKIIKKYKKWKQLFIEKDFVMNKGILEKIDSLQPDNGHYRYYQSFDKIGLKGQRPVEERYKVYQLDKIINKNSVVLDLGSNIGCMSLHIAERAKEVHGVEFYSDFNKIANLIKNELAISNCFFHTKKLLNFKTDKKFDVILSLAVHGASIEGFTNLTENIYKKMIKKNGYLVFESRLHKGIPNTKFTNHLLSEGFVEQWSGNCQCKSNYSNKQNQNRTFHVLRLESK